MTPWFDEQHRDSGAAPAAPEAEAESTIAAGEPESPVTPVETQTETEESAQAGTEEAPQAEQEQQLERDLDVERDLDELTAKAEKADEYLELAQRTKADFENYRKRTAREAGLAQERGVAKLAKELLPAIDNLDRAVQAANA